MQDTPTRLLVAYGLIAFLALAAAGLAWWIRHNAAHRRYTRHRKREQAFYRQRDEAAGAPPADRAH